MKSLFPPAIAMSVLLCVSASGQDLVRLKTGATMEGVVIEQDERSVTLEFAGGTMQLLRSQIAEIQQSATPADAAMRRALLTLSRFQEQDSHHFVYRDGRRCGYRTLSLRREDRDGIPGYALRDRLVFMPAAGAAPELELSVTEFVDADLRPVYFRSSAGSGAHLRSVEGVRESRTMRITETLGGRREERTALLRDEVQFPRMLLRRLAGEAPPEGSYPRFRIFRPEDVTFGEMGIARRLERLHLRGRERDLLIFERRSGDAVLETWVDMAGQVVREEIGSNSLVSLAAPEVEVLAWARGESGAGDADLGLEFVSEPTGLRFLRPDLSWDLQPGQGALLCSLFRAGPRATVDVYLVPGIEADATEEGVALEVLGRIQRGSEQAVLEQLRPETVGARKGVQFLLRGMRRGEVVKTLGAVVLDGGQGFCFLCASPEGSYTAALPGFLDLLGSVRILAEKGQASDPWELAESALSER